MKQFLSWATLLAVLASMNLTAARAVAQQRPAPQIALIDLGYIFSQHVRFKQLTEELRRDIESAENELRANKQQLQKMVEQLDEFSKGSPDYKQHEEDVVKRESELRVQVGMQKRDFNEKEARIYYTIYKEVMDQVRYYADKHGILLVMQFSGEPVDESDPGSIKQSLSKQVLHHNPAIDITPIILDAVNPPVRANRQSPPLTNRPQGPPRVGVPAKR
ncbi:MAG TPA: OmpH family outer membrane protein [Pirellulales bacterium]